MIHENGTPSLEGETVIKPPPWKKKPMSSQELLNEILLGLELFGTIILQCFGVLLFFWVLCQNPKELKPNIELSFFILIALLAFVIGGLWRLTIPLHKD